jgi:hypothetical protein
MDQQHHEHHKEEEEEIIRTPSPLPLIRSLSSHHVMAAISDMITMGKCFQNAGMHPSNQFGGWTRWYVMRPHMGCTELSKMRVVTIWTDAEGDTNTAVNNVVV